MQRYAGEKEPGILEEERRVGRQDCGRGGEGGGGGAGRGPFLLHPKWNEKIQDGTSSVCFVHSSVPRPRTVPAGTR